MRENCTHGSEGGEGASPFRPLYQSPDPRVILAEFGGFRCAPSTLRYALESTIVEFSGQRRLTQGSAIDLRVPCGLGVT